MAKGPADPKLIGAGPAAINGAAKAVARIKAMMIFSVPFAFGALEVRTILFMRPP
jgi:hypothetical protein